MTFITLNTEHDTTPYDTIYHFITLHDTTRTRHQVYTDGSLAAAYTTQTSTRRDILFSTAKFSVGANNCEDEEKEKKEKESR